MDTHNEIDDFDSFQRYIHEVTNQELSEENSTNHVCSLPDEIKVVHDDAGLNASPDEGTPLLHPPTENEIARSIPSRELLFISLKHCCWIVLSAVPTVAVVCLAGYAYSRLPWTRDVMLAVNVSMSEKLPVNYYFDRTVVFWFDDVMRTLLICLLNVIVACVLYSFDGRRTIKYIVIIVLPITFWGFICFSCLFYLLIIKNDFAIWFYYIDIVIFMLAFFVVVAAVNLTAARHVVANASEIVKRYVLPMYGMALGTAFTDIYFSKTYRTEKDGSIFKYFQRLVVYPVLMDSFLGLGEFFVRKLHGTTVVGEAHSLYLIQVRFGILGRYMNLTAGDLTALTITCSLVMVKDVMLHRMGRVQCWVFFKLRRLVKKEVGNTQEFRSWYFTERFRNFRACVLNNDLLHEFTVTLVTPILFVFFRPHRLLYHFDDDILVNNNGNFELSLFFAQLFIQLSFLFITYGVIFYIEGRFNGVDLRYAFARRNMLQEISQVIIYLWGMLQILSAVRVIPNHFQCDSMDICSCHFDHINKTAYGCIKEEKIQW